MRVRKQWQNLNFLVNHPFKLHQCFFNEIKDSLVQVQNYSLFIHPCVFLNQYSISLNVFKVDFILEWKDMRVSK